MGAVHDECGRFMQWLRDTDASDDVRRVANIVQANLDTVIPSVSNAGQRATVLAPLLRRDLDGATGDIETTPDDAVEASLPWSRLHGLTIGPFRGFRREEAFDLNKDVVLFYGPNGSGKSSLCEAIEFALLGYVEEAAAKRIEDLEGYFNNIHERRHVAPRLLAIGGENGVPISANPELLRFAIIEKNRIDGFARLAARTPAQAGALIATLFGLDGFNEFVNNFTATLDRQLQLATPQRNELALRRAALEMAHERVASNESTLHAFSEEQEAVAAEFEQGCSHARLLELLGLGGTPGRLQELNGLLEEQPPPLSGVLVATATQLRKDLRAKLRELSEGDEALRSRATQVSYRDLYRAVHALEGRGTDACPACETPLNSVVSNPFERANQGLQFLQDLAELEATQHRLQGECARLSGQLREQILSTYRISPFEDEILQPFNQWLQDPEQPLIWTTGLINKRSWTAWLKVALGLQNRDVDTRERQERRAELVEERHLLDTARDRLNELNVRRNLHNQQIQAEQERIERFDDANADLIQAVEEETIRNLFETRIQTTYNEYLELLRRYRDGLPATLLADLNETARDLYNQFNADDHATDKLTGLALPLRGGERIQVAFAGNSDEFHDALYVLSEGHLRCLGLAILLAKNIKLGLPLLIFDDAVNAIDHDHRAGIRTTIFGDPRLSAKQIIVTCHSNEFIKDIQNQLAQDRSRLYVLDHHAGDHQPRVQGGTDRNYLVRARERLADGDQRQCLAFSRQALENLTARLWKALYNRAEDLGSMPLVLRSPTSRPELRNLTDQLEKRITQGVQQGTLQGDNWTRRQEGLQELLRIPEGHVVWRYLNKGTHDEEDREDFEIQFVRQIVDSLEKISFTLAV